MIVDPLVSFIERVTFQALAIVPTLLPAEFPTLRSPGGFLLQQRVSYAFGRHLVFRRQADVGRYPTAVVITAARTMLQKNLTERDVEQIFHAGSS